jgi:hypothetical protein
MKILLGGDFYISPYYTKRELFSKEIKSLFQKTDLNIVNLECPVLDINDNYEEILKTGPALSTNETIISQLNSINTDFVTTANNHILDYGEIGLNCTINILDKNNIEYVGIGKDIFQAQKYKVIVVKDIKVGIVNFCENEWSTATVKSAGANPLDLIDNLKQIKNAKKECDFVLVIIHGGHEYYNLPSPRMVKQYRFFAENGADAIIGHHTNCISGYEIYKNVPIFYSLGNMLFTIPNKNLDWYTGLLLELEFEKSKKLKWKIHPIEQSPKDYKVSLLNGAKKETILNSVDKYSKIINNDKEFAENWKLFTQSKKKTVNIFSPISSIKWRYLKGALNRLGFNKLLLKNAYLAQILNHMRCEAHKDVVSEILNDQIYKNK